MLNLGGEIGTQDATCNCKVNGFQIAIFLIGNKNHDWDKNKFKHIEVNLPEHLN